jgi:hypothetical protein
MRSHGVPGFPDPAGGNLPKPQVVTARQQDPSRFDAADGSCHHLLPAGGGNGDPPAAIAQDWSSFRAFARCMRSSEGVADWPDPSSRSGSDRRPAFALTAAGLDPTSPQLRAKARRCAARQHLAGLPAAH